MTAARKAPARRGRPSKAISPLKEVLDLTVEQLVERGQGLVTGIVEMEQAPAPLYEQLADTLIALRTKYVSPGRDFPDWRGRSIQYREAAAQVYAAAAIPPDSESSIQSRIRYRIDLRLREVAPADQLDALGYKKRNAAEREADRRAAKRGKVLDADGPAISSPQGPISTRAEAFRAMTQIVEQVVWGMPAPADEGPEYREYMAALVDHTTLCEQLWALAERHRSNRRNTLHLSTTFVSTRTRRPETTEACRALRQDLAHEARILSAPAAAELEAAVSAA